MSLGATLVASFLVTLVRPATWPLALAAFLLRGGIVLVLAPIVVIPSAVGLANVIAPTLTSFVFGGVSTSFILLVVGIVTAALLWLVVGGFLAAAAEVESIRIVASDEDVVAASGRALSDVAEPRLAGRAWRVLAVRLVSHLPTVLAVAFGAVRIVAVTYRELTVPSDVVSPIVLRVARTAPEAVIVILVAWLIGEALGALAARRIVLSGDPVPRALGRAAIGVVRHPIRSVAFAALPLVALVAVLAPSAAAAATTWTAVRAALATGAGFVPTLLLIALFVALWAGGLLLIAVIAAWRGAVWTVAVAGTFGASRTDPEGG